MLKQKQAEYQKALAELESVQTELREARRRFDDVTDDALIDVCVLEISALSSKLNCALRSVRSLFL